MSLLLLFPGRGVSAVGSLPVVDTFTDADGTLLEDHTPDQATAPWVVIAGDADIQSNRLRAAFGLPDTTAVIDTGSTDHVTYITFVSGTASESWLIVRYRIVSGGTDTYFAIRNNSGTLQLYERESNGSLTLRDSDTGAGSFAGSIPVVTCSGGTVSATCGSASVSYAAGMPDADATYIGIFAELEGTFDNLNAVEITLDVDNRDASGIANSTRSLVGIANATRSATGIANATRSLSGRLPN